MPSGRRNTSVVCINFIINCLITVKILTHNLTIRDMAKHIIQQTVYVVLHSIFLCAGFDEIVYTEKRPHSESSIFIAKL